MQPKRALQEPLWSTSAATITSLLMTTITVTSTPPEQDSLRHKSGDTPSNGNPTWGDNKLSLNREFTRQMKIHMYTQNQPRSEPGRCRMAPSTANQPSSESMNDQSRPSLAEAYCQNKIFSFSCKMYAPLCAINVHLSINLFTLQTMIPTT